MGIIFRVSDYFGIPRTVAIVVLASIAHNFVDGMMIGSSGGAFPVALFLFFHEVSHVCKTYICLNLFSHIKLGEWNFLYIFVNLNEFIKCLCCF